MTSNKMIEKSEVKEYFNGTGFERWNKIYSKSDEINTVQKNICLLYTSPSPRDRQKSRMPSSA